MGYGPCRRLNVERKSCSYLAFPIHLFRHFCYTMYRLATIGFVIDDIMVTIADHTVWKYDRLMVANNVV